MLHPVGPLPASVYWRRRAVVTVAGLGVLLLAWAALGGGGGGRRQDAAVTSTSPTPAGAELTSLGATPASGDPGRAGDGGSAGRGSPTGTGGGTATAAAGPAAAPAGPCADSALSLRVVAERPAYRVGDTPVVDLQVRNASTAPCSRDLGAAQQEVLLYSGTRRLWSSNDCYPGGSRDVRVLQPADAESFSVTWSGLSSKPKCAGDRVRVGAGTYQLVGRLGTLVGPRAPLVLR